MSTAAAATQRIDRKEFRRVRAESAPKEKGQGPENLIRVTAQRGQRSYISYAIALLTGSSSNNAGAEQQVTKKQDTIQISGMGAAIFNAVNIAEIVKRRVKGLHQLTEIASETVKDSYEGIESKKTLDVERKVATILITLSTKPLDTKHAGYQAPLPEDQVTEQEERAPATTSGRGAGRGSGRGGRGSARGGRGGRGSARGGRGSARGGRGSGRGGRGGAAAKEEGEKKKATTEKKAASSPKTEKPAKAAKPDYDTLGDEAEEKLDRQKGEGHAKAKPSGQAKPKSVRATK